MTRRRAQLPGATCVRAGQLCVSVLFAAASLLAPGVAHGQVVEPSPKQIPATGPQPGKTEPGGEAQPANKTEPASKTEPAGKVEPPSTPAKLDPREAPPETSVEEAKREARLVREAFRRDRARFREDLRRAREEQRRQKEQAELEQRLRRIDPDRGTFWRREQEARLGREIVLTAPAGRVVALFRQKRPMQFMGYRGHLHDTKPSLVRVLRVPAETVRLSDLLRGQRGHYVFLAIADGPNGSALSKDNYEPLQLRVHGHTYDVINVYSDGRGFLRVEVEQWVRDGQAGPYHRWTVDRIFLEQ